MKSLKKSIFMPAFQGVDNFSGNVPPDHNHHLSQNAHRIFPGNRSTQTSMLQRMKGVVLRWLHRFSTTAPTETAQFPRLVHTDAKLIHLAEKSIHTKASTNPDTEWVTLIKTNKHTKHTSTHHQLNANHFHLVGQAVLCVGGRAALYPDYLQLIEAAGGCFMAYRASPDNTTDYLQTLLERVNMVICPVDCVSHNDYFTVKRYCKRAGKSCAFLACSNLPTFKQGLEILINQSQKNNHLE